jgi:proteasome lid subunit RPN8/RPN11
MNRKPLKIQKSAYQKVIQHARAIWPLECCGALLGVRRDGQPTVHEALPATGPQTQIAPHRFQIGASDLVGFQALASRSRQEILGFYHSHPLAPPEPSQADLDGATWTGCFTLIVSVAADGSTEAGAYLLVGDLPSARAFQPVRLEIVADPHSRG